MRSGGRYQRVTTYSVKGFVLGCSPPTPDAVRADSKSHTFRSQFLLTSRLLCVSKLMQIRNELHSAQLGFLDMTGGRMRMRRRGCGAPWLEVAVHDTG